MFDYHTDKAKRGLVSKVILPFGNTARPGSVPATTDPGYRIKTIDYAADWDGAVRLPSVEENWVDGVLVSKAEYTHQASGTFNGQPVWETTSVTWAESDASAAQTSIAKVYQGKDIDPLYRGLPYSMQAADGTKTAFAYERGNVDAYGVFTVSGTGAAFRSIAVTGIASSGSTMSLDNSTQDIDAIDFIDARSTRTETIRNEWGLVAWVKSYVYSSNSWSLIDTEKREYDAQSNLILSENSTGKTEFEYTDENNNSTSYSAITFANGGTPTGRLQYSKDATGVITKYTYDNFGRVIETLRLALPAVPELLTRFTYDADGRIISKTIGPDSGENIVSTYTYNFAGQLVSKIEQEIETTYSYETANGKILSATETFADGSFIKTTKNSDGSIKSKTGTAIVPEYYEYTVEGATLAVKTSYHTDSSSPRWSKVWKDGLGRVVKTEASMPAGTTIAENTYNNKGQLEKSSASGYADTLYAYDSLGALTDTALASSGSASIGDTTGRRTGALTKIVQRDSHWWRYDETIAYPDAGTTGVTTAKSWTRLTGFNSVTAPTNPALPVTGAAISEVITQDSAGNETRGIVFIDHSNGSRYDISTILTGSIPSVSLSRGGLTLKSASPSGITASITYDELSRPKRIEDRTSASSAYGEEHIFYEQGTTRKEKTYNDLGHLVSQYTYDSVGRVRSTSALAITYSAPGTPSTPNENNLNHTHYHYNTRGQTTHIWGDSANPVKYDFNDYGDMTAQTTYRTFPSGTASWSTPGTDPDFWPSGTTGDTTTFTRNPADGSLASRTDAKLKTVSYTYNIRGQVSTAQSARTITSGTTTTPLETTYAYDPATGDLMTVAYNDTNTPGITYTRDRMGRATTIADATGTRTLAYSGTTLRLEKETLGSDTYGPNLSLNYDYGPMNGATSVATGFTLTRASATDYTFALSRHAQTGRLSTITSDAGAYNFAYQADSDFVNAIAHAGGAWGQTRTFEPHRNLVASITTQNGIQEIASYTYEHDALARRHTVTQTGALFDPYLPAPSSGQPQTNTLVTQYAYDARSQITESITHTGGATLKGRNLAFTYDDMGNRTKEIIDSGTHTYTTNNLNQYTARATPSTIPASGVADPGTTVSIDNTPLTSSDWQNNYFFKAVPKVTPNPTTGALQAIAFLATNGSDTYSSTTHTFVRPQAEAFTYDPDGNLLADGLWDYRYNAADQLVEAISKHPDQTGSRVALRFTYDYMGRRASKTVHDADSGGFVITSTFRSRTLFVYEGWTLIAEYDDSGTGSLPVLSLLRTYTWGPDLTGGAGAGGIGGLLAIQDHRPMHAGTYNPGYDGNGNVTALVRADTGEIAAAYEYDAYGNPIRASGYYAKENPIRFSTKYHDQETGLAYYGYRYYSPSMGRFINRDPLMEEGGLNIYAMTANNPIGLWDYLGLNIPSLFSNDSIWDSWEIDPNSLNPNGGSNYSPDNFYNGYYDSMLGGAGYDIAYNYSFYDNPFYFQDYGMLGYGMQEGFYPCGNDYNFGNVVSLGNYGWDPGKIGPTASGTTTTTGTSPAPASGALGVRLITSGPGNLDTGNQSTFDWSGVTIVGVSAGVGFGLYATGKASLEIAAQIVLQGILAATTPASAGGAFLALEGPTASLVVQSAALTAKASAATGAAGGSGVVVSGAGAAGVGSGGAAGAGAGAAATIAAPFTMAAISISAHIYMQYNMLEGMAKAYHAPVDPRDPGVRYTGGGRCVIEDPMTWFLGDPW